MEQSKKGLTAEQHTQESILLKNFLQDVDSIYAATFDSSTADARIEGVLRAIYLLTRATFLANFPSLEENLTEM